MRHRRAACAVALLIALTGSAIAAPAGASPSGGATPTESAMPDATSVAPEPSVPLPVPDAPAAAAAAVDEPDAAKEADGAGDGADAVETRGAPVDPTPLTLSQPDGATFTARRWGDGVLNGYEDLSGHTIDQAPSGDWVYAEAVDAAGDLVLGSRRVDLDPAPSGVEPALRPEDPGPLPTPGAEADGPSGAPHVPHTGNAPTLVILAQFTNQVSVGTTPSQWASSFFGASSSVADYYDDASYGALDVIRATESNGTANDGIVGWVTLPRTHPNTGSLDSGDYANVNATAVAAVTAADPFVNFAAYDTNANGSIEPRELHVVVITAGYEASSGCGGPNVWGHRWTSYYATPPTVDGKVVLGTTSGGYTMFGEAHCAGASAHMATIGIMVHELGHDIGWPDLYDTTGATQGGVGRWSVMANGSWNATAGQPSGSTPPLPDPFLRSLQGWVTPTQVSGAGQSVTVPAATSSSTVYRVLANPGGVDWAMAGWGSQIGTGEYFLIENRQLTGWDAGLPGCGILVWHIDETRPTSGVNNTASRRLVQLEQADGLGNLNGAGTNRGDAGDPYPGSTGNTSFAVGTNPNSRLYGDADSGVAVTVPAGACTASKSITVSTGATPPTGPPNDAFASATAISGASGSTTGTNAGGSKEAGEPDHAGDDGGASSWWRWTAPISGRLTVRTDGSSFDTLLAVYTGSAVGSLTAVGSNDDGPGGLTSVVRGVAVTAGTTYRIAVDGYDYGSGPATGSITLRWSMPTGPSPLASWGAFIDRQCRDLLDALCSAQTRSQWISYLTANPSEGAQLVASIRATAHHTTYVDPVARLYRAFFLRHPDLSGLRYWISQRASGRGLFWSANFFAASTEFRDRYGSLSNRAFVELVYTNVLGRLGEQSGMDFWTSELSSGRRTRGAVMVGFSESAEYKRVSAVSINLAVITLMMLRRPPTASELGYWNREAAAGRMDAAGVAELILSSPEYAAL